MNRGDHCLGSLELGSTRNPRMSRVSSRTICLNKGSGEPVSPRVELVFTRSQTPLAEISTGEMKCLFVIEGPNMPTSGLHWWLSNKESAC